MQEVAAVSSADDVVLSQSDVDEMFKLSPTAHREAETAKAHRG